MHIPPSTHEHGSSAKVFNYEADYQVDTAEITWTAQVSQGEDLRRSFSGVIPLGSPALAALAEQAVRDAIMKRIDSDDDRQQGDQPTAGGQAG